LVVPAASRCGYAIVDPADHVDVGARRERNTVA
jgi:hypothetical protein